MNEKIFENYSKNELLRGTINPYIKQKTQENTKEDKK